MLKASEIKRGDVVFLDQAPHVVKHLETKSPSSRGAVTLYKLRLKICSTVKKRKSQQKAKSLLRPSIANAFWCSFRTLTVMNTISWI